MTSPQSLSWPTSPVAYGPVVAAADGDSPAAS